MDLELFIPITKIDVARRLVVGTIAEEVPDRADEIMDYATAKPMFEAWSAEIAKASNGRSAGNLRAMHGNVAAGKLDQILFDDDARRIATVAKVVDDAEWKKVLEGVYTGFSMGGRYARRWPDVENPGLTRYTPEPMEVSLVDHPCIPSATFEVVKADGTIELHKFKPSPAESDVSRDALEFADPGFRPDRKKRYPLDTEAHIRVAWAHIHHAKNEEGYTVGQLAQIKAKIVAAWKAKIDKNGPPLAAGKLAHSARLAKGLGDVSQLALILEDLAEVAAGLDDAGNAALKTNIENLVTLLHSLVDEATIGIVSSGDSGAGPGEDEGEQSDAGYDDDGGGYDEPDAGDGSYDERKDDTNGDAPDDEDAFDDGVDKRRRPRSLRKAFATLAPRLTKISAQVGDLAKRLERLEAQPLPGGPVTKFVTVSKSQDMAGYSREAPTGDPLGTFQRHLESLPAHERAHLLTKLALRNPIGPR